jgi:hypothetical protein
LILDAGIRKQIADALGVISSYLGEVAQPSGQTGPPG